MVKRTTVKQHSRKLKPFLSLLITEHKNKERLEYINSLKLIISNLLNRISNNGKESILIGAGKSEENIKYFDAVNILIVAKRMLEGGKSIPEVNAFMKIKAEEAGVLNILDDQRAFYTNYYIG